MSLQEERSKGQDSDVAMELNLGRSERLDVHHCLALLAAQDDTLVVAERDAPDGLARVANLADEGARFEVFISDPGQFTFLYKVLGKEKGGTHPTA